MTPRCASTGKSCFIGAMSVALMRTRTVLACAGTALLSRTLLSGLGVWAFQTAPQAAPQGCSIV